MASVISLSDARGIENRYLDNGWIDQRDQDRRENSVWWTDGRLHDLRIPGRELYEWFDDFYAYIDKTFPSREIPKERVRWNPKPSPRPKPKPKLKYPSEKDLTEDEEVSVWSDPVFVRSEPIHDGLDLRKSLEDFNVNCLGHTLKLQVKNDGHCRITCTACNRSTELLQLIEYVLRLAPDIIRGMGGIIFEDGTFCFPVGEKSIAISN